MASCGNRNQTQQALLSTISPLNERKRSREAPQEGDGASALPAWRKAPLRCPVSQTQTYWLAKGFQERAPPCVPSSPLEYREGFPYRRPLLPPFSSVQVEKYHSSSDPAWCHYTFECRRPPVVRARRLLYPSYTRARHRFWMVRCRPFRCHRRSPRGYCSILCRLSAGRLFWVRCEGTVLVSEDSVSSAKRGAFTIPTFARYR